MAHRAVLEAVGALLDPYARRAREDVDRWLVEPNVPGPLAEAMWYCVEGGKRVRAALVEMSCEACGGELDETVRRAAVAVELIHAYSLVHDDLPVLDDDELRRGRATAHVRFGEAMAILAGDALLTRAFGVLAEARASCGARLSEELAFAAGAGGMIAGQVADLGLCDVPFGGEGVTFIHERKTAALFRASTRMGAVCAGAEGERLEALGEYGRLVGLGFQVADDVLDVTGDGTVLGKTTNKDAGAEKRTSVAVLGLDRSKELCRELASQAADALAPLGEKAAKLAKLASLLAERTH